MMKTVYCPVEFELKKMDDFVEILPATKHNTSIGKDEGKYKFYNSTKEEKLFLNTYEIEKESIILGNGGLFNIHYGEKFTASKTRFSITNETSI